MESRVYIRRYKPNNQLVDKICDFLVTYMQPQEREIMLLRMGWGLPHGMNMRDVAKKLGRDADVLGVMERRMFARLSLMMEQELHRINYPEYKIHVKTMGFKPRTLRTLLNNGLLHAEHICRHTRGQLYVYPGIGIRVIKEIEAKLLERDMALSQRYLPHNPNAVL